jgi:hypothetical protein
MDDYDDWVERLDPHARQRFEWMNGRITELTNGWRIADGERDAARREVERLRWLASQLETANEDLLAANERLSARLGESPS